MRILLVASRFFPHRGGLESVVYNLAQQLKKKGHEVLVVTNRYPRNLRAQEILDGIPVRRFLFIIPRLEYVVSGRRALFLAALWCLPFTLIRLALLIHHFRPHVVNLHYLGTPGFFLWFLRRVDKFPLVVSLHGGDVDGEPQRGPLNRWLFGALLRQADAVTACSKQLVDQALALQPGLFGKTYVIHNGVDVNQMSRVPPYFSCRPYVLGVGQLVPHKGFDLLIEAFAEVAEAHEGVDLLIAGDGPERQRLREVIDSLGLSSRIKLLGSVSPEDVARLMRGCAFVVVPSRRESFGLVALEAMAAGKAVLGTYAGGLPEFADTPANRLIQPDQKRALVDALEDWLNNIDVVAGRGEQNRSRAVWFSWSLVVDQYISLYQTVTGREARSS